MVVPLKSEEEGVLVQWFPYPFQSRRWGSGRKVGNARAYSCTQSVCSKQRVAWHASQLEPCADEVNVVFLLPLRASLFYQRKCFCFVPINFIPG